MALRPPRPLTTTGTPDSLSARPSPSWPFALLPNARTVPSDFSARTCVAPEVVLRVTTAVTPVRKPVGSLGSTTCPATLRDAGPEAPAPSWCVELSPHVHTVPSALRATLVAIEEPELAL